MNTHPMSGPVVMVSEKVMGKNAVNATAVTAAPGVARRAVQTNVTSSVPIAKSRLA